MNRVFLIGNGFDLAHGLKTSYNDFIPYFVNTYFSKVLKEYNDNGTLVVPYKDDFFSIRPNKINPSTSYFPENELSAFIQTVTQEYTGDFNEELLLEIFVNYKIRLSGSNIEMNWFDVEEAYFTHLKRYAKLNDLVRTKRLNNFFSFLINSLRNYIEEISKENTVQKIEDYNQLFIYGLPFESADERLDNWDPKIILNFNYTDTITKHYSNTLKKDDKIIPIHGSYNDDIVFGYGDEMSDSYKLIEDISNNEYLRFFKSFSYFKNINYPNLERFIEFEEYEVFIVGHSCGLSDRLLLNYIFEHDNCSSITILHHGNVGTNIGTNNYTDLTMNISRHFKNKLKMRNRIKIFDPRFKMPQQTKK